jgi:hypothetical protein
VPVPFAHPRAPDLAYDPAMVALTAEVSAHLRDAHDGEASAAGPGATASLRDRAEARP